MNPQLQSVITLGTLLTGIVGGTVVVEQRYAKSADVQEQLDTYYAKGLKLRILEIELKPAPLSTSDRAMLEHLRQELREATD